LISPTLFSPAISNASSTACLSNWPNHPGTATTASVTLSPASVSASSLAYENCIPTSSSTDQLSSDFLEEPRVKPRVLREVGVRMEGKRMVELVSSGE
jgi:hypothetical protein